MDFYSRWQRAIWVHHGTHTVGPPVNCQKNSDCITLYFADIGPTLGQWWIFIHDGGEQKGDFVKHSKNDLLWCV